MSEIHLSRSKKFSFAHFSCFLPFASYIHTMRITPITSIRNIPSDNNLPVHHQTQSMQEGKKRNEVQQSYQESTVNNNRRLTPVNQSSGSSLFKDLTPQDSALGMVVILSDHFKILCEPQFSKSRLKKCSVRLTDTHLSWGSFESESLLDDSNLNVLPVPELIGTQIKEGNFITSTAPVDSVAISIFAYPFKDNPSRSIYSKSVPRRVRKSVTFIIDSGSSYCENHGLAEKWSRAIEWLVFDKTLVKVSSKFICSPLSFSFFSLFFTNQYFIPLISLHSDHQSLMDILYFPYHNYPYDC